MNLKENVSLEIIKRVIILALITIGITFLLTPNPKPYIYGLIFGTSINILNFRLMSITLEKAVTRGSGNVKAYVMSNYLIRYIIYGVVIYISAIADYISLLTVVIGLFMVKAVIVSDAFISIIKGKSKQDSKNN